MNLHPNAQRSSDCVSCLPGFKCIFGATKLTTPATILTTSKYTSGKYGWIGVQQSTPRGFVAETTQASYAFYCPAGKINSSTDQTDISSACTDVPAQQSSPVGGYPYGIKCMNGFQCVSTGSIHWNPALCEKGHKCIAGVKTACPIGEYQPLAGKDYCLDCPKGFYCPNTGTHSPTVCGRGKYCAQGVSSQTNCPQGTFNPSQGLWQLSQCLKCQGGKYCIAGTHTPVACDAGYYCTISATSAQENICPIGSYCPAGSDYPIPCTPGKYCPTQGMSAATQNCDAGYYCVLGAKVRNPTNLSTQGGAQCPAGSYCIAGSTIPTRCPSGTYSNTTGATSNATCQQCDATKYCDQPGSTAIKGTCSQGYYCPTGSSSKYQVECPAGSKCQAAQSTHTVCSTLTPISYQPLTRSNTCITCPPGHTCTSTATTICDFTGSTAQNKYCFQGVQTNCPAGQIIDYIGASSSSACIKCPPGFYCPNIDGQLKLKQCSNGEKCDFGKSSVSAADACDSGSFCPPGERIKPCTAGNYCTSTGLTAPQGQCNAGYTCPQGSNSNQHTDCPQGSYCPAGSAFQFLCPPGTFSNSLRQDELSDCQACTAGQHCKGRGLTAPQVACEAGYFCPQGSVTQYDSLCGVGNKCPVNQSAETKCPVNQYQGAKGQDNCLTCPDRYECNRIGMSAPEICPVGHYCPSGTAKIACPVGTYNPNKGMKQQSECLPCKRGFYCATTGLSNPTNTCDPGYVCITRAATATPNDGVTGKICPIGYYCDGGTEKETPCPPGKYGDATGLVSQNSCKLCVKGKYCPKFGLTLTALNADSSLRCLAGYFCNGGAKIPTPKDLLTEGGRPCSIGHYCPIGTLTEEPCQAGYFNPYQGASSCQQCPVGYKCPNTSMSEPLECDAGHFCEIQTVNPQDCPAGTFSSKKTLGASNQCTQCLPGFYCVGGKQTTDGQCSPGYVCPQGASTATPNAVYSKSSPAPAKCPAGHFCQEGTSVPKPCPIGFWQELTGQSTCDRCPQTYYCQKIGIKLKSQMSKCADGFHCISGAKYSKPIDGGITGNPCEAGNYCTQGAQTQCAGGTYQPRTGSSACQDCPPGYYCPVGSQIPVDCPTKHYCPIKTQTPRLCPDGSYNQKTGLESYSQCVPCPSGVYCTDGIIKGNCDAGFFCKSGAKVKNPVDVDANLSNYSNGPCPIGHFCTSGTKTPTQCSGDKIRATQGAKSDNDCETCPAGFYCIAGFSSGISCPPGYFCIAGSTQPAECPLNTYNLLAQRTSISDCISCNSAAIVGTTYCNDTRITSLDAYKCPAGHFCIDGIDDAENKLKDINICPKGSFSANRGKRSACDTCTAGYYCNQGQMSPVLCKEKRQCPAGSSQESVCRAGRYCPQGTGIGLTCPAGYYCPQETQIPLKCPHSTYCIAGSQVPTPCPAGTIATLNPNNFDLNSGCQSCDPGTYMSTTGQFNCIDCEAGYVCSGSTSSRYPTVVATHNGYKCKTGHYCPVGSYRDTQCPKGTYNPSTGKSALSDCFPCDSNTYNFLKGQDGCLPCPPSATSSQGAQICTCKGLHRIFQQESGSCVCQTGFRPQSDTYDYSASLDCVVIASTSCGSSADASTIRDQLGQCVGVNDCSQQCGQGVTGSRISGIGICQCQSLTDVDSVCNASCANSQPKVQINADGKVQIKNSDGTVNEKNVLVDNSNIAGSWSCPNGGCKVVSMKATSSGRIAASYEPFTNLFPRSLIQIHVDESQEDQSLEDDRQLQSTPSPQLQSAIVCIHQQDTFIFQINLDTSIRSNSVYPIYIRESILNTDSNFDNSQFLNLEKRILSSQQIINYFAYQFDKNGVFVFATNKNQKAYTLVRVMTASQTCPNQTQFIQPMTQQNLLAVGVQKQTNIPAPSNWALYLGMILMFVIILLGFLTVISYMHSKAIAREKEALLEIKQKVPYCKSIMIRFLRCCCCKKKKKIRILDGQQNNLIQSMLGDYEIQQKELTIQDLKEIRNLANMLNIEIGGVLNASGFGKDFDNVHKHAVNINRRLKRIADENNLKPSENILEMRKKRKEKEFNLQKNQLFDSDDQDDNDDQRSTQQSNASRQKEDDDRDINNKIAKYMGKLQAQGQGRYNEDVDRRRNNLDNILASSHQDLTDQEKKQLLMDHQTDIARINNLLKIESQKQQDALRRKLLERRNKNKLIKERIKAEEEKKQQLSAQTKQEIGLIKQNAKKDLAQISDYDALKIKQINKLKLQLYKEREEHKAKTKQELQKALKRSANKQATQQLLAQFDEKEKTSLIKLEDNFRKREEYIKDNIQDIAKDRIQDIKQQIQKQKEQILQKQKQKGQVINKKIDQLKNMQECDYINKDIEKVDDENQIQRRDALKEIRNRHIGEMEKINQEEQEIIDQIDDSRNQLDVNDLFGAKRYKSQVSKQIREDMHKASIDRKDVEDKLKKLNDLGLSPEQLERQKQQLLLQLSDFDRNINILERQANAQKSRLQEKLYQRRGKVRQKMIKREDFEKRRLKQLERNNKQELLSRQDLLSQQFDEQVKHIKRTMTGDQIPYAVEKALDTKQGEELNVLLAIMLNEKAERLKLILHKLFQDKLDEFQLVKEEFVPKYNDLQEDRLEGRLTQQEYNIKYREIKQEEADQKKNLELKYYEAQHAAQAEVFDDLDVKHDSAIHAMKKKQAEEKKQVMKMILQRDQKLLRELQRERRDQMDRDIESYKEELQRNLRKKMEEREKQRAKLLNFQRQSEETMAKIEKLYHEQGIKREKEQRERLQIKRKQIQAQKERLQNQMKKRQDLSEQQKQDLIREHQNNLRELNKILETERMRQSQLVSDKLKQRKHIKEKYKLERDRKLAVFKLHYEKLLEDKMIDILRKEKEQEAGAPSQFQKLTTKYGKNEKIFQKMTFPHKLSILQENRKTKESQDLDSRAQTPNVHSTLGSGRSSNYSRRGSFAFGRSQLMRPAMGLNDPQNLMQVLEKLGDIESILERRKYSKKY